MCKAQNFLLTLKRENLHFFKPNLKLCLKKLILKFFKKENFY